MSDDFLEFFKHTVENLCVSHPKIHIVRCEVQKCLKQARALRDEPLLEEDQRKMVNEICDQLSLMEKML